MTSINYSSSTSSAIRVLQSTNRDLDRTQNRISTGLKINSASDGAAAWKAASTLRGEVKSYEAAKSSMDYNKGLYQSAAASAETVADILNQIATVVSTGVAAAAGSTARTNAQSQLTDLQAQLKATIADAGVGGLNLLNGGDAPSIMSGFSTTTAASSSAVTDVDLTQNATGYVGYASATKFGNDAATSPAAATIQTMTITNLAGLASITAAITEISDAAKNATDYAATLGSAATRIQSSQDLLGKLADIKKSALSSLVDADMEEESAKLSALQVKQQLATQALSIANNSMSNILRLFQ